MNPHLNTNFNSKIITNKNFFVVNGLLFFVSALLILVEYPRERKFALEFQKGTAWQHENLIAPYDFPIYKLEHEYKSERDSLLKQIKPFFRRDAEISNIKIDSLKSVISTRWNELILAESESGRYLLNRDSLKYYTRLKNQFTDTAVYWLTNLYTGGILDKVNVFENLNNKDMEIRVISENFATEIPFYQTYSKGSALELINRKTNYYLDNKLIEYPALYKTFKAINMKDFITDNLKYDPKITEKVQQEMLNTISHTAGIITRGEAIVLNGEIVTTEKLRKLESYKRFFELNTDGGYNKWLLMLGQFILIFMSFLLLYLFLMRFRPEVFINPKSVAFLLISILLVITLGNISVNYDLLNLYVVPFAIVPIIVNTFFDSRLALFTHLIAILLTGFLAPNGFEFVLLQFIAGFVSIVSLQQLQKRGQLLITALAVFSSYTIIYFGISLIYEGNLNTLNWRYIIWFTANSTLILLIYPLIFLFEKSFGFLSDLTLMELSDTNNSLLRKLAETAPGTFQHSMQVANLAEEASFRIGGNPLLTRVGALYHDIGKMKEPQYFTENQSGDYNPHVKHSSEESATIIISHVTHGIELAQKHRLPLQIINFIRTHHGTTRVEYFYRTERNEKPNENISTEKYTYPGPRPYSKEMAVLMMADSVEAASRSLPKYSVETISQLVDKIVDYQISQKQFDEAPITYAEVTKVKDILKHKLSNIHHARISYPEAPKSEKE